LQHSASRHFHQNISALRAEAALLLIVAKKPAPSSSPSTAALPPVLLLTGSDSFTKRQKTEKLREALTKAHGEIDVISFHGPDTTTGTVLDECRSFGLMVTHKLIIVDAAEALFKEETREHWEAYATKPCESATLVLRNQGKWNAGKFDKLVSAEKCDGISPAEAISFALERAKKVHRASLDRDAAELLIERLGTDAGNIDAELGKLACAAMLDPASKDTPLITIEVVQQMVGMRYEDNIWNIQDTLLAADRSTAVVQLRHMRDVLRHPTELLFFAVTDLARKLHGLASAAAARENLHAVAGQLKLWGSSKDVLMEMANRVDPDRARRLVKHCLDGQYRTRTGLGDADRVLERLVIQFTAVARDGQRR
jgi:DNA polymerase III delta subunit